MEAANVDLRSTALVPRSGTRLLMLTLLLGFTAATRGQEWETIFTLPPPAVGDSDRSPAVILSLPFPTPTAASPLLIGMNSDDHDLVVLDLATGTFSVKNLSAPRQNVIDLVFDPPSDSLYALSRNGVWNVRRSLDKGVSWTVVDSLPGTPTGSAHGPRSFARDDEGNLYISGHFSGLDINSPGTWIVRKSSDGGSNWTTVYELPNASGRRVIFVPGVKGGLFSVGRIGPAEWTVRRSRDGGVTWPRVDSFVRPGKGTAVESITSDRHGRIYAAGFSTPDPTRWEMRMSEDGGDSWKTISPPLTAAFTAERYAFSRDIAVDAAGTLFVAGGLDGWAVARRTSDGVWLDPELPFGTVFGAGQAHAITIDKNGNIYAGGHTWLDGRRSLVIQKLAATVLPPLAMRRSGNSAVVSWPSSTAGNRLESATAMGAGATWTTVATPPVVIGDEQVVTVDIGDGAQFFRLSKP